MTVKASRNVCVRVLETLSSTKATPAGRSVTDSRRFILITGRQLLSAPVQPQLPFPARSRACTPGRNRGRRLESSETDQTYRRESQSAWPEILSDLSISNRRLKSKSFGRQTRRLQPWRDRNPSSFGSRGPGCRTRFRESVQSREPRCLPGGAYRALL